MYYKIMSQAALKAGTEEKLKFEIFSIEDNKNAERSGKYDELLYGSIIYDLSEYGKEVLELYPDYFSLESVRAFTFYLKEKGDYINSIRLLSRFLAAEDYIAAEDDIPVLYPDAYKSGIENISEKEHLPVPVFFALIREESHFSPDIVSSAGAVGLSQLMPSTAEDVAKRMRLKTADLTDPGFNMTLGGWYLHNLLSRTDTVIQALLAYNGGLTRVRRWKKEYSELPEDLFLEALPYRETSLYGRKVLVSAVIYGYLYYNFKPEEMVNLIFSDNVKQE